MNFVGLKINKKQKRGVWFVCFSLETMEMFAGFHNLAVTSISKRKPVFFNLGEILRQWL